MLQTSVVGCPVEQHGYQPLVQSIAQVATVASSSHGVKKFNGRKSIGIGMTLIAAAILGMVANSIDILFPKDYGTAGEAGHGYWVGSLVSIRHRYCLAYIASLKYSQVLRYSHRC
jgi:hypothetical protein